MIWKTIDLDPELAAKLRDIVDTMLTGKVDFGKTRLSLAEEIGFIFHRREDHIELSWSPAIQTDQPGIVDPDLICARLYKDRALIDLRIGSIRIDYRADD